MYEKEFEQIFSLATGRVDDIEISLSGDKSFSVSISKQNIESFKYADSLGLGIRIVKEGKVGYAYTEEMTESAFERIVDEAIANSELVESREPAVIANHPEVKEPPAIFNPELEKVNVAEKIELAKRLEADALALDSRIFNVPYASYSDGFSFAKIANSKGLDKETKSNYCMAYTMVLAQENEDRKSGYHYIMGRDFYALKPELIAKEAVTRAIELLNADSPATGKFPVILNNDMTASLLGTFSGIFSAKNVHDGKSLLKDRIGEVIASKGVTIVDDGLHPDGFSTAPFDSEGYPTQRTVLVEKGVLKSYLHNTTTALVDEEKSTGNGSRSYKSALSVSTTNFILEPDKISREEMISAHDTVIEIVSLQGLHSGANPVSGDFSLSAEGFLYEKGVRIKGVADFTVSGKFFEVLKNIEMVGSDFKFNYSACGTPAILIKELDISSK